MSIKQVSIKQVSIKQVTIKQVTIQLVTIKRLVLKVNPAFILVPLRAARTVMPQVIQCENGGKLG
ncbi:MAG: hypothetical protein ACRCVX_12880 [Shewanella sp.]